MLVAAGGGHWPGGEADRSEWGAGCVSLRELPDDHHPRGVKKPGANQEAKKGDNLNKEAEQKGCC
jgi:hypothetical protein